MIRWMFLAALTAAVATPVLAQESQNTQEPPKRIRNVLLFGDDTCPKPSSPDEIVVCASGGESPYRIPKRFRAQPQVAGNQPWSNRVELIEDVNRAGLPNSCSPIGSGGQTGCTRQFIQQWAQERLNKESTGR